MLVVVDAVVDALVDVDAAAVDDEAAAVEDAELSDST